MIFSDESTQTNQNKIDYISVIQILIAFENFNCWMAAINKLVTTPYFMLSRKKADVNLNFN
jgi:hypothetical protein